ncbi:MAG: TonB-dependent receptor [Pirellulaceae bacterium]|nr:TonB-dependent receptor [Pirellulaceae bacterium]
MARKPYFMKHASVLTILMLASFASAQSHVATVGTVDGDASWIEAAGGGQSVGDLDPNSTVEPVGYFPNRNSGPLPFLSDLGGRSRSSCDSGCDAGCAGQCGTSCAPPWWAHRRTAFAEYLHLRPTDSDIVHSVEQNDSSANAFPTGPVGITAIEGSAGFRAGAVLASSYKSSLVLTYTGWEGDDFDRLVRNGSNVLNSQILHPSSATTGSNSLRASAISEMEFNMFDASYRNIMYCSPTTAVNWFAGLRYGQLEQSLLAQQEVSVATGLVTADVDIDFSGFGILFGLDAERRSCTTGLLCYSRGVASFLGGDWEATYRQSNQFGGGVIANDFEEFRITPVLEAELGIGWQNDCGSLRATTGYMASAWYNALKTRSYIEGVREGAPEYDDESIGFIGLTSRIEYRF